VHEFQIPNSEFHATNQARPIDPSDKCATRCDTPGVNENKPVDESVELTERLERIRGLCDELERARGAADQQRKLIGQMKREAAELRADLRAHFEPARER
jgi:hypothetical protein